MTDLVGVLAAAGGDRRPWGLGRVLSVDTAGARLTVEVDDVSLTLRRVAGPYRVGDTVAIVRDRDGSGQIVAGVVSIPAPTWRWATVTAVDGGTSRLTVDVDGESFVLPHATGTYSISDQVLCLFDDASGVGGVVLSKVGNPPSNPAAPSTPTTPTTVTSETVGPVAVTPTWSGTYRTSRAAWDRWNTTRYGGRSDAYQGNDTTGGGGQLTGLVTFGDKVKNLGLSEITSLTIRLRSNGSGYASSLAFTLQGSPHGSKPAGAPSSSGVTASSGAIARVGGSTTLALPSDIREGFRTGAIRGLVVVGSTYGGLFGTSKADGLALSVTGTKAI